MRTDRRGFLQVLAGAAAWLAGGCGRAAEPGFRCEIHEQTRNTVLGPVGREWWPRLRRIRRAKAYPRREHLDLPAPETGRERPLADVIAGFPGAEGFGGEPVSLAELSRLLQYTNGVTGPPPLRAAPSAGARYAGEMYVVASRVTGLEPGVYYYLPPHHRLVRLAARPDPVDEVAAAVEHPRRLDGAAAVVLLSNVFARYGSRYANRGYRYALIDTGHIGENLRLVARSAGLAEVDVLRFRDDALNDLLGIDGRREAVCAVHALGRAGKAAGTQTGMGDGRPLVEAGTAPRAWSETERYHATTKLVPGEGEGEGEGGSRTAPDGDPAVREPRSPGGRRPEMSVEQAIRNRRSASRFDDRLVPADVLDWILAAAAGQRALARVPGVDLLVALHRGIGREPGLYRVAPAAGDLEPLRMGDLRPSLVRACLGQAKAGDCGVAFFLVGRLRRATRAGGLRAYRDLLIEAGAIGQRIYLAAEAAGLTARNLAAFRDDELNRLLGVDGREEAVLHLTLAGAGE